MNKSLYIVIFVLIQAIALNSKENRNVLLLYDKLNNKSEISILYLKERLISDGIVVKGIRIKDANKSNLRYEKFDFIIIYSEVRAFHMRRHLKKWLISIKDFKGKKIALFITSITEKYGKKVTTDIKNEVKNKDGIIVDATSSATGKITDQNKKKRIETFSKKFISEINNFQP